MNACYLVCLRNAKPSLHAYVLFPTLVCCCCPSRSRSLACIEACTGSHRPAASRQKTHVVKTTGLFIISCSDSSTIFQSDSFIELFLLQYSTQFIHYILSLETQARRKCNKTTPKECNNQIIKVFYCKLFRYFSSSPLNLSCSVGRVGPLRSR